jgi:hypothetical protein
VFLLALSADGAGGSDSKSRVRKGMSVRVRPPAYSLYSPQGRGIQVPFDITLSIDRRRGPRAGCVQDSVGAAVPARLVTVLMRASGSTGLGRCAWKPERRARARSASPA